MNLTGMANANTHLQSNSPQKTIEEEDNMLGLSQVDKFNSTFNSVKQEGGDVDFFFTASIEP